VWCLLSFGHQNAFDATSIMLALNVYFDKYLEIIVTFDDFIIQHVYKDENTVVNDLTQHA
jgi:Mlc titration factor MtfA (ptsG expression regulator)